MTRCIGCGNEHETRPRSATSPVRLRARQRAPQGERHVVHEDDGDDQQLRPRSDSLAARDTLRRPRH
eukprot:2889513-Alexandrium_andersonii.AAC.1